jgi:isochorismate synthase
MTHGKVDSLFSAAVTGGYSAAICRLPGKEYCSCFAGTLSVELEPLQFESALPVFVVSPFGSADLAYTLKPTVARFDIAQEYVLPAGLGVYHPSPFGIAGGLSRAAYINWVLRCRESIRAGDFRKVVAARNAIEPLPASIDPLAFFRKVCTAYPEAFAYIFTSPDLGTWIGATPEKLMESGHGTMHTVALAGTRPSSGAIPWGAKEREEQELVEEFVNNVLDKHSVNFELTPGETVRSGALDHLCSFFSGEISGPASLNSILAGLNPTPAVCGLPKGSSLSFIRRSEGFDRRFYSGFVGLTDHGSTSLFVNLRCMELFSDAALLYAGAGITAASDPEKEFLETEMKMQALRSLL